MHVCDFLSFHKAARRSLLKERICLFPCSSFLGFSGVPFLVVLLGLKNRIVSTFIQKHNKITPLSSSSPFSSASGRAAASSTFLKKNRSTITSQSSVFPSSPLRILTSLARSQKIMEMDSVLLLLHGIAISTKFKGLSVSQRAMVGMLT